MGDTITDDVRYRLRSGLGTVLKMASSGIESMREVVVRSSEVGRKRVDLVLLRRERQSLLAKLGESLLPAIERGEIRVSPETRHMIDNLEDVNRRIQGATARVFDNAFGAPRASGGEAFAENLGEDLLPDDREEAAPSPAEPAKSSSPRNKPRRRKT